MQFLRKHLRWIMLGGAAVLVVLDQWFKYLALTILSPIQSYPLWEDVLELAFLKNEGAAFGIFQGRKTLLIVLVSILLIVLIGIVISGKVKSPFLLASFSLVIAGGIGNLIDLVAYGYVVDYIYVKIIDFAIFNFADCCVVLGAIGLMLYLLFAEGINKRRAQKRETALTAAASEQELS